MTPSDLSALADQAFNELEGALAGAPPEVMQQWRNVRAHRQNLELGSEQTASSLSALHDELTTDDLKARKAKMTLEVWDSVDKASSAGLTDAFAALQAELAKSQAAALAPTPAPEVSLLLRQEIDAHMAGSDMPVSTLLRLAQNPRYSGEVKLYGPSLLAKAGQPERVSELLRGIAAVAPRDTAGSMTTQRALALAAKASGHVAGLTFTARNRVATAQKPPVSTDRYRPDTLIQRH